MSDVELVIRLDCFQRRGPAFFNSLTWRDKTAQTKHHLRRRQLSPGKREIGLDRNGRFEPVDGGAQAVQGEPVEIHNAHSVGVDGARFERIDPHPRWPVRHRRHPGETDLRAN